MGSILKGVGYMVSFASLLTIISGFGLKPYVIGNVWQDIEIKPCKVPEFFLEFKL